MLCAGVGADSVYGADRYVNMDVARRTEATDVDIARLFLMSVFDDVNFASIVGVWAQRAPPAPVGERAPGVIAALTMTLERILYAPLCVTIDHMDGVGLLDEAPWLRVPVERLRGAAQLCLNRLWCKPTHFFDGVVTKNAGGGRLLRRFRFDTDAGCQRVVPRVALMRAVVIRFAGLGARVARAMRDDRVLIDCMWTARAALANVQVAHPEDASRAASDAADELRRYELFDYLRRWAAGDALVTQGDDQAIVTAREPP